MSATSSHLRSILSVVSSPDHARLQVAETLERYLYPALDALPRTHVRTLTKALEETEEEIRFMRDTMAKLDYEGRQKILEGSLQAAEYSNIWKETRRRCSDIIVDWVPMLWQLGVEKGRDRTVVRKCLLLCEEVRCRMVPPAEVAMWDAHVIKIRIADSKGKIVLEHDHCTLGYVLGWMWIELLTTSLLEDTEVTTTFVEETVAILLRNQRTMHVLERLIDVHTDACGRVVLELDGVTIDLGSTSPPGSGWAPAKREKLCQLQAQVFAPKIRSFRASPTSSHFSALTKDAPSLQAPLLDVTRQRVRDNLRSRALRIKWEVAAIIYCRCGEEMDLTNLNDILAKAQLDSDVLTARLMLFKQFEKLQQLTRARSLIRELVKQTLANCWMQVAWAYPGWDNAWDWLDEALEDGKRRKEASRTPSDTTMTPGDERLARFTALLQNSKTSAEVERAAEVSLSGQKRGRVEGSSSEWYLVQQCLSGLKGASRRVRGKVDVRALAKEAIGGDSLAKVDGVFGALHDSTTDSSVHAALHAMRDILQGKWEVHNSWCIDLGSSNNERPAKKTRIDGTKSGAELRMTNIDDPVQ